jgi:hypothetical protein
MKNSNNIVPKNELKALTIEQIKFYLTYDKPGEYQLTSEDKTNLINRALNIAHENYMLSLSTNGAKFIEVFERIKAMTGELDHQIKDEDGNITFYVLFATPREIDMYIHQTIFQFVTEDDDLFFGTNTLLYDMAAQLKQFILLAQHVYHNGQSTKPKEFFEPSLTEAQLFATRGERPILGSLTQKNIELFLDWVSYSKQHKKEKNISNKFFINEMAVQSLRVELAAALRTIGKMNNESIKEKAKKHSLKVKLETI